MRSLSRIRYCGASIPRKSLGYLTRNPLRCRVCCDVDPDEVSAVEPDDDEGIKQVETDSRDNEQVHSGNIRRVITQEGSPSLAGRSSPFDHVPGDARLRDFKPECLAATTSDQRNRTLAQPASAPWTVKS